GLLTGGVGPAGLKTRIRPWPCRYGPRRDRRFSGNLAGDLARSAADDTFVPGSRRSSSMAAAINPRRHRVVRLVPCGFSRHRWLPALYLTSLEALSIMMLW